MKSKKKIHVLNSSVEIDKWGKELKRKSKMETMEPTSMKYPDLLASLQSLIHLLIHGMGGFHLTILNCLEIRVLVGDALINRTQISQEKC